jgi:benzoate membrane transport protein
MRFSVFAAALVAVMVGFGGTSSIIVAAAHNVGADAAEAGSWLGALNFGIGIVSIGLSWWSRTPIVAAWSLAGAVLIAALPPGITMPEAVAAFILASILMTLSGLVPALGAAVARLPASIGAAMLAGLILRFVIALFVAAQAEPFLVLPLLAVFLVARRAHAASAPLLVIAAGLPLAWALGHPMPGPSFALAVPIWTTPDFHTGALIGLGIPLFLVTMATQQVPGAAVITAAGYTPPVRAALISSGVVSLLMSPLGGYSINLASLTAAICVGPDVHPDPAKRWLSGVWYGALYLVLALFGAGFATMLAGLPPLLITTVAGAALLSPMMNALTSAVANQKERFAAVTAFVVTASGITALGLGGPFWGLVAGVAVLTFERLTRPV